MHKIVRGYMISINGVWKKMYYSHIDFPCWKAIMNDNSSLTITPDLNISAYYVDTCCTYKNFVCQVIDKKKSMLVLNPPLGLQNLTEDFAHHGYDPVYEVNENEIEEIWEERTPVDGFKFDIPSKIFIKKNGEYV